MNYIRLVFVLCTALLMLVGCGDDPSKWPKRSFDETKWTQTNEKDRFVFVRDLIESKRLLGAPKSEILRLLGKPSYAAENGEYMTYIVKAEAGNVYILDIRFESAKSGSVAKNVFVRSD